MVSLIQRVVVTIHSRFGFFSIFTAASAIARIKRVIRTDRVGTGYLLLLYMLVFFVFPKIIVFIIFNLGSTCADFDQTIIDLVVIEKRIRCYVRFFCTGYSFHCRHFIDIAVSFSDHPRIFRSVGWPSIRVHNIRIFVALPSHFVIF